jgi:hypothetical protein
VKCIGYGKVLAGFAVLAVIPIWLIAQILVLAIFDAMAAQGLATREYHLDYAVTPILNLGGAGLVWWIVLHYVREFKSVRPQDSRRLPESSVQNGAGSFVFDPRKVVGVLFIVLGATAMASWFILSGVLFVIVGVSLIMNVRIWRN